MRTSHKPGLFCLCKGVLLAAQLIGMSCDRQKSPTSQGAAAAKEEIPSVSSQINNHCVLLYVVGDDPLTDAQGKELDISTVEDMLIKAIDDARSGEFDGNEFDLSKNAVTLYIYGPDADRLFESIRPALRLVKWPKETYAIKRYGEPGTRQVQIKLSEF